MAFKRPKVCLRFRPPLSDQEKSEEGFASIIEQDEITYEKKWEKDLGTTIASKARFDKIFSINCSQLDIFQYLWTDVHDAFKAGISSTILMYGATGSGKTYTMDGDLKNSEYEGVLPRVIRSVFDMFGTEKGLKMETMKLGYVQVYMDRVDDMLSDKTNLPKKGDILSTTAQEIRERTYNGFMSAYINGSAQRHTASNSVHDSSSRSHSIAQVTFTWSQSNSPNVKKSSILTFVDLAGSEPTALIKNRFTELRNAEGKSINRGLLFLGTVVSDLVTRARHPQTYVNFRDHALTHMLEPSLRGDSFLSLVLCLPDLKTHGIENTKTIKFGLRVLKLPLLPKCEKVTLDVDLKATIEDQQQQQHQQDHRKQQQQQQEQHHDSNLIDEGKSVVLKADDDEVTAGVQVPLTQPSNKDEVKELKQALYQLRTELALKDCPRAEAPQSALCTISVDLELAKVKLGVLDSSRSSDAAMIAALRNRIEEKEAKMTYLQQLIAEMHVKLTETVRAQEALASLSERQRTLDESLRSPAVPKEDVGKLRIELERYASQLEEKEGRLAVLNAQVWELHQQKSLAELEASSLRSRLWEKVEAEHASALAGVELKALQEARLNVQRELATIRGSSGASIDIGVRGVVADRDVVELKRQEQQLMVEITRVEKIIDRSRDCFEDMKLKIDETVQCLPERLRETVHEGIRQFYEQVVAVQELRDREYDLRELVDECSSSNDPGTKTAREYEFLELEEIVAIRRIGNDLDRDLANMQSIREDDELREYFRRLPYTAEKLTKFLELYPTCKHRFVSMGGVDEIARWMRDCKHVQTFAVFCELLRHALYDNERLHLSIRQAGILDILRDWFIRNVDTVAEYALCRTMSLAIDLMRDPTSCALIQGNNALLRFVLKNLMSTKIQLVLLSSCSCLGRLCPKPTTVDEMQPRVVTSAALCARLVLYFYDGSPFVRREAAMCASRLCHLLEFKAIFHDTARIHGELRRWLSVETEKSTIDRVIHILHQEDQSLTVYKTAFSVLLLSLIEERSARIGLRELPDVVLRSAYGAIATGYAGKLSLDNSVQSMEVKGTSEDLPYTAHIFRGKWVASSYPLSDGGILHHGMFLDNPMYRLKIPKAESEGSTDVHVAIVVRLLKSKTGNDNFGEDTANERPACPNCSVISKTDAMDYACYNLNGTDKEKMTQLCEQEWETSTNKTFFCVFTATKSIRFSRNVDQVEVSTKLRAGETYILVPCKDLRGRDGEFVLSVVCNSACECQLLKDSPQKQVFEGDFYSLSKDSGRHSGFSDIFWRNSPQLVVKSHEDSPCVMYVVVSYLNLDENLDDLRNHFDDLKSLDDVINEHDRAKYPNLCIRVYENSFQGMRYVSNRIGAVASNGYPSHTSQFLCAKLEPSKMYSVVIAPDGNLDNTQPLRFRAQIFTAEMDVKVQPLVPEKEWFSVDRLFATSTGSFQFVLCMFTEDGTDRELKSSVGKASTDNTSAHVISLSMISHALVPPELTLEYGNGDKVRVKAPYLPYQTSEGYARTESFVTLSSQLRMNCQGSIIEPIKLHVSFGEGSPSQMVRVFGFSSLNIKLQVDDTSAIDQQLVIQTMSGSSEDLRRFAVDAAIQLPSRLCPPPYMRPVQAAVVVDASRASSEGDKKVVVDRRFLERLYAKIALAKSGDSKIVSGLTSDVEWVFDTIVAIRTLTGDTLSVESIRHPKPSTVMEVFIKILRSTQCGAGLFSIEELELGGGEEGRAGLALASGRRLFLTKLVHFVELAQGHSFDPPVVVDDVLRSQAAQNTAKLLQSLCRVASYSGGSVEWVRATETTRLLFDGSPANRKGAAGMIRDSVLNSRSLQAL